MGKKNKQQHSVKNKSSDESILSTTTTTQKLPHKVKKKLERLTETLLQKATVLSCDWNQFVEIHHILEEIQGIEKVFLLPKLKRDDKFETFLQWCSENGAIYKNVEICQFQDSGYGFKVTEAIEENELWLTVPRNIMLSQESATSSALGPLIANDLVLSQMPNITLSLYLLNERCNPDSFWSPYIKILPDSYDTPMYFTLEELQMLRGSNALDDAVKLCRNVARQYAYFHQLLKNQPQAQNLPLRDWLTYDNYRWAVSTVMTRQNFIPSSDGSSQQLVLVPLWDMCNHSNGKLSTDYDPEKNHLKSYVFRSFEIGEQLNIFYGNRHNADFLLHNGFVYPENRFDMVAVKLELRKSDQLYAKKEELLSRLQIPVAGTFYIYNGPSPLDGAILAFHRIAVMNKDALEKYADSENISQLAEVHSEPGDKVDQMCWKVLEMRLRHILENYPTSLQDDKDLLDQSNLSQRAKLAVQLCHLEKKILSSALDFITARDTI